MLCHLLGKVKHNQPFNVRNNFFVCWSWHLWSLNVPIVGTQASSLGERAVGYNPTRGPRVGWWMSHVFESTILIGAQSFHCYFPIRYLDWKVFMFCKFKRHETLSLCLVQVQLRALICQHLETLNSDFGWNNENDSKIRHIAKTYSFENTIFMRTYVHFHIKEWSNSLLNKAKVYICRYFCSKLNLRLSY